MPWLITQYENAPGQWTIHDQLGQFICTVGDPHLARLLAHTADMRDALRAIHAATWRPDRHIPCALTDSQRQAVADRAHTALGFEQAPVTTTTATEAR